MIAARSRTGFALAVVTLVLACTAVSVRAQAKCPAEFPKSGVPIVKAACVAGSPDLCQTCWCGFAEALSSPSGRPMLEAATSGSRAVQEACITDILVAADLPLTVMTNVFADSCNPSFSKCKAGAGAAGARVRSKAGARVRQQAVARKRTQATPQVTAQAGRRLQELLQA